jgi:hypothetical protein
MIHLWTRQIFPPKKSDGGKAALETLKCCLKLRLGKTGVISTFESQVDRFLYETDPLGQFLC